MGPRSGPLDAGTRRGRKRTAAPGEARRAAMAQVTAARSRRQACARGLVAPGRRRPPGRGGPSPRPPECDDGEATLAVSALRPNPTGCSKS